MPCLFHSRHSSCITRENAPVWHLGCAPPSFPSPKRPALVLDCPVGRPSRPSLPFAPSIVCSRYNPATPHPKESGCMPDGQPPASRIACPHQCAPAAGCHACGNARIVSGGRPEVLQSVGIAAVCQVARVWRTRGVFVPRLAAPSCHGVTLACLFKKIGYGLGGIIWECNAFQVTGTNPGMHRSRSLRTDMTYPQTRRVSRHWIPNGLRTTVPWIGCWQTTHFRGMT